MLLVTLSGCVTPKPATAPEIPTLDTADLSITIAPTEPDPGELLTLPALEQALPDVQFYRSTEFTGRRGYLNVEIIIALSPDGSRTKLQSPVYTSPDSAFVETLIGATATPSEQFAVGLDIANLFAAITYDGEIRSPQLTNGQFSAELWHGRLHWREVVVRFEHERVVTIELYRRPR